MGEAARPVGVERVRAAVQAAPTLDPRAGRHARLDPHPGHGRTGRAIDGRALAPLIAVALALVVWNTPTGWLILAAVAAGVAALNRAGARAHFGFGDGFLPFRGDPRWPTGVQEDDDFQWSWPSRDERVR